MLNVVLIQVLKSKFITKSQMSSNCETPPYLSSDRGCEGARKGPLLFLIGNRNENVGKTADQHVGPCS